MIKKWICGQKSAVTVTTHQLQNEHGSKPKTKANKKGKPSSSLPQQQLLQSPNSPATTIASTTLDISFESTPKTRPKKLDFEQPNVALKELDDLVARAEFKEIVNDNDTQGALHYRKNTKKNWWCVGPSPPPERYDWVDVEQNAAIQIQKLVRYVQTRDHLEQAGCTTAHMRNRIRERQANLSNPYYRRIVTDDTPSFFQCCGVSLLLYVLLTLITKLPLISLVLYLNV
jgi:hypothetical protein